MAHDLFISHAWDYDERYQGIVRLLDSVADFSWRDYSFPKDYPAVDRNTEIGKAALRKILNENIRQCSCFILVAGMFVNHRDWVQAEIKMALDWRKPILAVRRRGQQVTPVEVERIADRTVNWNSNSIVGGVRDLTGRW